MKRIKIAVVAAACALATGCAGNPVPEPPNAQRPDPVDIRDIVPDPKKGGFTTLYSTDGAAKPGLDVWVWNLEQADPPVTNTVGEDGSFRVVIPYQVGDELRIQVREETRRSLPVDVEVVSKFGVVTAPKRAECVAIPLELDLLSNATASFALTQSCSGVVRLTGVRWRNATAGFTADPRQFGEIASGDSVVVEVDRPSSTGFVEDILFVDLEVGGSPQRYPVSVYAGQP